ncbi:uncharacterized protein LOC110853973 [Folsomia candida]|uniref:Uncharacterized protein n=1 Tax=Folsomia candida TaxID=158441 RepID=A0A226DZ14_FOLCA|nr:uncharacterized protein LOC110853973 [Folsomia candida]OXA50290.1 hypothetical protein Fcan01_15294 [Folsomia candida]
MKRLERCKGETSYHKIESDTDGESSPNSSGVVTTSTPKKRSDSEQSRNTEDKVCQIWEDFDHWISNEFSPPGAKTRDHDKPADEKQISCDETSSIIDAGLSSAQVETVFGGNERTGIHGSGIFCRNPGCVRHSSSCTLLSQSNRNHQDDTIQRQRGCYSLEICDPRPPRSSNFDPGPTMFTVSPYLVSIFVLLATSVFVFAILILWSTRFYENGSTTIQNWWSPRPYGRNSGG